MGLLRAAGKALNFVDNAVTDARASHSAQKEAREFAATVKGGQTYYSVVDCHWPWGKGRLLMEHTASAKPSWAHGQHTFGHLSAAGLWLSYGPIHERRPAGLQTLGEYQRRPQFPPNAADALTVEFTPAGV